MTGAQRRTALKAHWYCRGRADQLVAIARLLGWSDGKTHAIARQTGIEAADVRQAIARTEETP